MTWLWLCLAAAGPFKVTYAAGYIPNVQFAPFYVADLRGYYREEGIELKMDYTLGTDVFKLVALGKVQIGSADPDAFLHAVARELPLVNIATLYQSYPIALVAKSPIDTPEAIRGKRIGISGTYGSSYLGLKAILAEANVSLEDIHLATIGFNQVTALSQDRVDIVVGYINNEPVRLEKQGFSVYVRTLGDQNGIPGVGLMTSVRFLQQKPEVVAGFLRATFRGMHDVITDPAGCYELVIENILPELKAADRYDTEFRVLKATLPFWSSDHGRERGYGQCDPRLWENLATLLADSADKSIYNVWHNSVNFAFSWKPDDP